MKQVDSFIVESRSDERDIVQELEADDEEEEKVKESMKREWSLLYDLK